MSIDQMDISEQCYHMLECEEGKRLWVYDDHDGKPIVAGKIVQGRPTFGIGHLVRPGEVFPRFPQEATEEFIRQILKKDLAGAIAIVKKRVKVPLNQNQFDALVLFVFNVGDGRGTRAERGTHNFVPGFQNSTLLYELNQGHYNLADDHFLDWRYDDHRRPVLFERRKREMALFNKPVSSKKPEPKKPEPAAVKVPAISSAPASKLAQKPKADSSPPPGKSKK